MKFVTVDPKSRSEVSLVTDEIGRLLDEGKTVSITIADEQETVSPQQAASRLGFSRQHVMRLIEWGDIPASQLPGSSYWRIPVSSLVAFEKRREAADRRASEWSRDLDAMGAPLE